MSEKNTIKRYTKNSKDIDLTKRPLVKWLSNFATPTVCALVSPYLGVLSYSLILLSKDTFEHKLEQQQKMLLKEFIDVLSKNWDIAKLEEASELEFIKDFGRTLEVVFRQKSTEKLKYFANLLRTVYTTNDPVSDSDFDIYFHFLSYLSYNEIYILSVFAKEDEVRLESSTTFIKNVTNHLNITEERLNLLLNKLVSTSLIAITPTFNNMGLSVPKDFIKTQLLDDFISFISDISEVDCE